MNKQTDGQVDMQTNIKMIYGQASKGISKLTDLERMQIDIWTKNRQMEKQTDWSGLVNKIANSQTDRRGRPQQIIATNNVHCLLVSIMFRLDA
jgi:hypothetical protein